MEKKAEYKVVSGVNGFSELNKNASGMLNNRWRTAGGLAIAIAILAVTGCSQKNPLLGTWKAKQSGAMVICKTLKFTKDEFRCDSMVAKIKDYNIEEDGVTVYPEENPMWTAGFYTVKDKNTISIEVPFAGKIEYNRYSY